MLRTVLCREGIYYFSVILLIFFGALLRQVNLLLLFGSFLICPVYIAWRLERKTMRGLNIKRLFPQTVMAGEPFHVAFELRNERKKLSCWAVIIEDSVRLIQNRETPNPGKTFSPAVYFEYVPTETARKKSYSSILPQRGQYQLGPIVLSTRFPVGFFRTTLQIALEDELIVLPRFGTISGSWFAKQHRMKGQTQQARIFRTSRTTGEFFSVRHWQQGDTKNWIHWRASAKHRNLIVRQCEEHQNQNIAILLDLSQPPLSQAKKSPEPNQTATELAVSFAATLIRKIGQTGSAHLLLATANPEGSSETAERMTIGYELQQGLANPSLLDMMFKRLAILEPTQDDVLGELFLATLPSMDLSTSIFLITSRPVDFSDKSRFAVLSENPQCKTVMQRIQVIDTSHPSLHDYFTVES